MPFTAPLFSSRLPTFFAFYQSSGFINETETCMSTDEGAVNHLEKSQYSVLSDHLMIMRHIDSADT